MDPIPMLRKYYPPDSRAYDILIRHSTLVTEKALETANKVAHLKPDIAFIREAAMLHDIGIFRTHAPDIGCNGPEPYIRHGVLGRQILEKEGLFRHALVCERHIGVGITAAEIRKARLPLPERDMLPISLEEQIICFADKFFSKNPDTLEHEKTLDSIIQLLHHHGESQVERFHVMLDKFGYTTSSV
jgi:uncharacterized protein